MPFQSGRLGTLIAVVSRSIGTRINDQLRYPPRRTNVNTVVHALDATAAAAAAAAALVVALVRIVVHAHAASDVTQTTREQRRWPPQPRRERLQSGTRKCRSSAFSAVDGEPTRVCLVSRCNASSGGGASEGSHE